MYTRNKDYLINFPDAKVLDKNYDGAVFTLGNYILSDSDDLNLMRYLISEQVISKKEIDVSIYKEFEFTCEENGFRYYKRIKCKKVSMYWVWQSTFQIFYIRGFLPLIENGLFVSDPIDSEVEFVFHPSKIRYPNKINIQVTGEHDQSDYNEFKSCLGYVFDHNTNQFRYPYFCQLIDMFAPKYNKLFYDTNDNHIPKEFCGFAHSNPRCEIRNSFFQLLCQYKKVNSYGRLMNNMGKVYQLDWAGEEQIKLFSNHKFMLCFENSRDDNDYYITEKIINAKLSGAIPIYWGTNKCLELFEKDSYLFLETNHMESFVKLLNQIKSIDQDESKFLEIRNKRLINPEKIECMRNIYIKKLLI